MGREGLRGDGRRQVGRNPQRLEVELAIAGIHATVMVDIRCRIEGRVAGDGAHRQVDRLAVKARPPHRPASHRRPRQGWTR